MKMMDMREMEHGDDVDKILSKESIIEGGKSDGERGSPSFSTIF